MPWSFRFALISSRRFQLEVAAGLAVVLPAALQRDARAGTPNPSSFRMAPGTFSADGAEENFNLTFTDPAPAGTTFRTWAWGGGVNAAGDSTPSGGIDSTIEVFNSANQSIAFN